MKKPTNVNERIDEIMLDRGLSPQEVAAKISRHVTTVTRILSGETTPGLATVKSIANALECPFEYLMKGTGPSRIERPDSENPYKDYAIKRLEKEADEWKQESAEWKKEYHKVWERFTNLLERVPLGKYRPVNNTAYGRTGS